MSVLNQNRLTSILTSQVIQTAMELPPNLAATLLQVRIVRGVFIKGVKVETLQH